MTQYSIDCRGVVKQFGPHLVLNGVDWKLEAGATAGLIGDSGAGKTTLLRIIAGLERATRGEAKLVLAAASHTNCNRPRCGMVFQSLALWPHLTARQHIECVLFKLARRARRMRAAELLVEVRLPESAWDRHPAQLSGGEGQRLALARALAVDPHVLLLDEPLAQLDSRLRLELLGLLRDLIAARGLTTICVTHHWPEVAPICNQVMVLENGRVCHDGPSKLYAEEQLLARVALVRGR